MLRFSVSISGESNEWVEREAESRDRSKSQIVAAVVEAARKGDITPFDGGERDRPDPDRLDRLEQLIAELERHVDTSTDSVESSSGEKRHTDAENAPNAPPNEIHPRAETTAPQATLALLEQTPPTPTGRTSTQRCARPSTAPPNGGDDGRPRRA